MALPSAAPPDVALNHVKPLNVAQEGDISFLDNPKYKQDAQATQAGFVFVSKDNAPLLPTTTIPLITPAPYLAFAEALTLLYPPQLKNGIHATATVHPTAHIDPTAYIGAGVVIGADVVIGAHTQIVANSTILNATVGKNCLIHSGAHIGQDGFGFVEYQGQIAKIPQVGTVIIEDSVEIGANTTIDRGALSATTVGAGTKLDNQVQIAHNVTIGKNVRICAQSGIAGSATLGDFCLIGAQSGVAGHVTVAPRTTLAAKSAITKNIQQEGQTLAGFPAIPHKNWLRQQATLARQFKKEKSKP